MINEKSSLRTIYELRHFKYAWYEIRYKMTEILRLIALRQGNIWPTLFYGSLLSSWFLINLITVTNESKLET